jgi:hypothetical protein
MSQTTLTPTTEVPRGHCARCGSRWVKSTDSCGYFGRCDRDNAPAYVPPRWPTRVNSPAMQD